MRRFTAPFLGALAACTAAGPLPGETDFLPDDVDTGVPPEAGTPCDPAAPTLGASGRSAVDTVAIPWTRVSGVWVGEPVRFEVPDDIVGLSITVDAGDAWALPAWVDLGGRVVLDAARGSPFGTASSGPPSRFDADFGTGIYPLYLFPDIAGTVTLPMNDATRPWSGCLTVVPVAYDNPGTTGALHVASRRGAPGTRMDVSVVVVGDADILDDEIDAMIDRAGDVLAGAGVRLDDVGIYTLDGRSRVPDEGPALNAVRAAELPDATLESMAVFLVDAFTGSAGTLGFAGGIPAPSMVKGTGASGVVLSVAAHADGDGVPDTTLLGETLAHELGHQLGLFHTTEAEGDSFDLFPDTPECPATSFDRDDDGEVSAEECVGRDGQHLMFWISGDAPQTVISDQQGRMLRAQPAVH